MKQPKNVKGKMCSLTWASNFGSQKTAAFSEAQMYIDKTVLQKMDPMTPMRSGEMIRSATRGTTIGSGHIVYDNPYARRQYYENKGGSPKHPQASRLWFERMKAQYKQEILRGAAKIATRN